MISRFERLKDGRTELSKGEHHSYREIGSGEVSLIPASQQMVLDGTLILDGEIQIDGELLLEKFESVTIPPPPVFTQADQFSYRVVGVGETVTIVSGQEMFLSDRIDVDGTLIIDGVLAVGERGEDSVQFSAPADNFSYRLIQLDETVVIPARQQMVVDGVVEIEGELYVDGDLSILPGDIPEEDEFLPWFEIPAGRVIQIKQYREYFLSDYLLLDGEIRVEGKLSIGA